MRKRAKLYILAFLFFSVSLIAQSRLQDFALYQNYPNPFNASTVISFSLPTSSYIVLDVFDVLGRKVATVVEGFFDAGLYSIVFNAENLASGIYFYRLTAIVKLNPFDLLYTELKFLIDEGLKFGKNSRTFDVTGLINRWLFPKPNEVLFSEVKKMILIK